MNVESGARGLPSLTAWPRSTASRYSAKRVQEIPSLHTRRTTRARLLLSRDHRITQLVGELDQSLTVMRRITRGALPRDHPSHVSDPELAAVPVRKLRTFRNELLQIGSEFQPFHTATIAPPARVAISAVSGPALAPRARTGCLRVDPPYLHRASTRAPHRRRGRDRTRRPGEFALGHGRGRAGLRVLDSTGAQALADLIRHLEHRHITVLLTSLRPRTGSSSSASARSMPSPTTRTSPLHRGRARPRAPARPAQP